MDEQAPSEVEQELDEAKEVICLIFGALPMKAWLHSLSNLQRRRIMAFIHKHEMINLYAEE